LGLSMFIPLHAYFSLMASSFLSEYFTLFSSLRTLVEGDHMTVR